MSHLIFGVVRVGATNVEPLPAVDELNDPDVVPAVELLGLALADAVGGVARLQLQRVLLAIGLRHVGQIDPEDPVHRPDIERVPGLVQQDRAVVQLAAGQVGG